MWIRIRLEIALQMFAEVTAIPLPSFPQNGIDPHKTDNFGQIAAEVVPGGLACTKELKQMLQGEFRLGGKIF